MVGSGFSLNAKPRSASSGSFPTWVALAETVVDHLYPAHEVSDHRSKALQQAKATSGFLRLAQEYEAAFGRAALERLIGEAVPDRQFEPGDLHHLLLELPWADVFTTNWDTLLERASDRIIERKYDVIRMIADIPASMKPRIVKLHGTLTTNRPFVFTEEDFRRYPSEQAPFVNLAQQAMMENVFCLLGFSGDDPNFLYWTGWVRDHLGPYAPQIYLVGWLDLSPPRRRMLENRGVVPIDCARLSFSTRWPKELRDQYAAEWFLWKLKTGEPYRLKNWPSARPRKDWLIPSHLEISAEGVREPREETRDSHSSPTIQELRSRLEIWRHNRDLYPGWLIAPQSTRSTIWWNTQDWIPEILRLLPEMHDAEKLECLEELNWRLEICLVPLSDGLPEAVEATLTTTTSVGDQLALTASSAPGNGIELRRRWLNLATALLRRAREEDNTQAFERWAAALLPYLAIWPELRSRLHYERCLMAFTHLDHKTVEEELAEWEVTEVDTYWKVRKAGLLAESGMTDEAFRATREALMEIRQQTRKDVADIPSLSREGWAMVLAQGFAFYPHGNPEASEAEKVPRGIEETERAERRWEVLRVHECDALKRLDECWRDLQADPPRTESEEREILGFDPGHRTRIGRPLFKSEEGDAKFLPAFQVRRLIEEVGLPPAAYWTDLTKSLLLRTALWLAQPVPHEALGLILRACSYEKDKTFNSFLTRNRIALLEDRQVTSLAEKVERSLAHGIPKATAALAEKNSERIVYWLERLRVAVELLSRLVLRLDGEQAEHMLQRALDYYEQPLFRERHWLVEPLAHLFSRTLVVLEAHRAQKYLTQFISLPLPGEGSFIPSDYSNWPDPLIMVKSVKWASPPVSPGPSTVRRLIDLVGLSPSPHPREYATRRLSVLLKWSLLTESEKTAFGEALWRYRAPINGFPEGTKLYNFAFLALPEPQQGLAEQVFRDKYLNSSVSSSELLSQDYLHNIEGAVSLAKRDRVGFSFSATEIDQIIEDILNWWRQGGVLKVSKIEAWRISFDQEDFQEALVGILVEAILPHLAAGSTLAMDVASMVEDLRTAAFPVERVYPFFTRLQPERQPEFADRLRQSLASSERERGEIAVATVWWWLQKGREFGLPEPPADLVREIALAISLRRSSCLKLALSAAEWILLYRADYAEHRFIDLVAEGLGYLLEEARYDAQPRTKADSGFAAEETSDVRARCAKVALAATRAKYGGRPVFQEWIRLAQTDPLPEVRNALREAEAADVERTDDQLSDLALDQQPPPSSSPL